MFFQMRLSNVMPNTEVKVELEYTELLVPTDGEYSFVLPTVVGPRYVGHTGTETKRQDAWAAQPYDRAEKAPRASMHIEGSIDSAIPIASYRSPWHPIRIDREAENRVEFSLEPRARFTGNRDFEILYRLSGEKIESGLLLYEGKDENFFLLMAEPPKQVPISEIPTRDYVFIVDVSGSMHGFPLETSKVLIEKMLRRLRPSDSFNLLFFSGGSETLFPQSEPATQTNIGRALGALNNIDASGGTELLTAMVHAMGMRSSEGIARSFIVISDGYISAEKKVHSYIRRHLSSANLFAFGIGTSVNRHLIDGLAKAGMGESFVVTNEETIQTTTERFLKYVSAPTLTDIDVRFEGFNAYDISPSDVPDLFAERPVVVFGKWTGKRSGTVRVSGITGSGPYEKRFNVEDAPLKRGDPVLAYLWARSRVEHLSDYAYDVDDAMVRTEVTALGLHYNLLTEFTSFIAVDERVVNPGNENANTKNVTHPLPLPAGVSEFAVGDMQVGVEPSFYLCVFVAVIAYGVFRFRRMLHA
ncbi:MAG: VWA domain-containing protein [Polyangiales bacterium]